MYYYSNLSGVGFSFGGLFKSIGKAASTIIGGGSVKSGPIVIAPAPALPPTTPTTTYDQRAPEDSLIPGVSNTLLLVGGLAAVVLLPRLMRGGRR